MTSRSTEIKVGVTVMAALAVLVAGTAWMAQMRLARRGYEITVAFDQVGGLETADPVLVAGVEVGRVERVRLNPRGVDVLLRMSEGTQLSRDAEFTVANMGLMGERFVAVRPGTSSVWIRPGEKIKGRYTPAPTEVAEAAMDAIRAVQELTARVELLLGGGKASAEGVGTMLEDAGAAAHDLRSLVGENRQDLREAVRDLAAFSRDLRELSAGNRSQVEDAIGRLDRAAAALEEAVGRLESASRPLTETARRVEAGEGSLGKLVMDDSLYLELRSAVRNLDSLVVDAKKNPKRYFTVEIF